MGIATSCLLVALTGAPPPAGMARVGPGVLESTVEIAPGRTAIDVAAFWLDVVPVTNAEFLAFVAGAPEWRRDRVARVFATPQYLTHWRGPLELADAAQASEPVTNVSWFAAQAYCEARGGRLPSEREWELAAAASATQQDARRDPAFRQVILSWYARSAATRIGAVGRGPANLWGIRDLHGLIWEWVLDFNGTLLAEDGRDRGDPDSSRFCGAAALYASDAEDYGAIMRYAMRSSLEGNYTTSRLGFRCARDAGGS